MCTKRNPQHQGKGICLTLPVRLVDFRHPSGAQSQKHNDFLGTSMRRKDLGGVATLILEPPNVPARIWLLSDESAKTISNSRCNALRWTFCSERGHVSFNATVKGSS
jgi:hypothetical protein